MDWIDQETTVDIYCLDVRQYAPGMIRIAPTAKNYAKGDDTMGGNDKDPGNKPKPPTPSGP